MVKQTKTTADYATNLLISAVLGGAMLLPYRTRVAGVGWLMSRIIAPVAGYSGRIADNLDYIFPDMPAAEKRRIMRAVPDNVGRSLIEMYSGEEFVDRVRDTPLSGPGVQALEDCHANNRPVILVSGHFGNYDAPRAALISRGYPIGVLYNPMRNGYFNAHYETALQSIGSPIFPRGRRGYGAMLRFIRTGGMAGFMLDQHMQDGEPLTYFGKPAATALSAAELALKYDAMMIPIYGVRQENGLDFEIVVQEPIPHSDPITMSQAANNSLEAITRQHMEQWFWVHRRWKIGRNKTP